MGWGGGWGGFFLAGFLLFPPYASMPSYSFPLQLRFTLLLFLLLPLSFLYGIGA